MSCPTCGFPNGHEPECPDKNALLTSNPLVAELRSRGMGQKQRIDDDGCDYRLLCDRAADEIERLTAELSDARGEAKMQRSWNTVVHAQRDRLRALLIHWTYEGHLETFEDRKRFRDAAHKLLAGAANETSG